MNMADQIQQPSGSVGPEDFYFSPPLTDQINKTWGVQWEDWKNAVDHGLGQLFPQVEYLTEEVEKLQQQFSLEISGEKVGQIVRESGEIHLLVKTQIDGHISALADVIKD